MRGASAPFLVNGFRITSYLWDSRIDKIPCRVFQRQNDDEGGETYYNGNTNLAGEICVIFTILQGQSPNEN